MNDHNINDNSFISLATSGIVMSRAIKVAIIFGTILVLINYGEKIIDLSLTSKDWFKIILTYLVPYSVSTWSAVSALKEKASQS